MIIELKLTNYKSFKDKQTFSMVASAEKKLREENSSPAETLPRTRLLHSAAVYGPNASGKSTLVHALAFLRDFLTQAVNRSEEAPIPVHPFLLEEATRQAPTRVEITFEHQTVRYQYGLALTFERIHEEWLVAYPKNAPQTWFERHIDEQTNEDVYYFGSHLKGEKQKLASLTRPNVPFLSIAAQFNQRQLTTIYRWFTRQLAFLYHHTPEGLALRLLHENPHLQPLIKEILTLADLGVNDFAIDKYEESVTPENAPPELRRAMQLVDEQLNRLLQKNKPSPILQVGASTMSVEQFEAILYHKTNDHEMGVPLAWNDESLGTRRLLAVGTFFFLALARGAVFIVDELDDSLHPLLVRHLIQLFHNEATNPKRAQLIFNTHDTTLLDEELFRRDQIWFTEKDNGGASHLYSLAEFEPRSTAAFGRGYMQGKYGAIPILGDWRELAFHGEKQTAKPA